MDDFVRQSAAAMRSSVTEPTLAPDVFHRALLDVRPDQRDAWLDAVLGIEDVPADDPTLPRDCVPYLPCPVDALLRTVELCALTPDDVVFDVGAGLGRAAAALSLLSGAKCIGLELQPALVAEAKALSRRAPAAKLGFIQGDAVELASRLPHGRVYFLYCPFSGPRLTSLLDSLRAVAATRPIRVCCVDMARLDAPWLELVAEASNVAVYRSREEHR